MKKILIFLTLANAFVVNTQTVQVKKMNVYVSQLMRRMTLEEKIGQLNLPSIGFDITGPFVSTDVESKIKRGLVGGVFNTYTPSAVKKLQDMAIQQTRLKIPLLFGYDVIHGHRTVFPIPLGLSCTWDTALIRRSASIAAKEATADGLCWTFSPMVDIARDPRWGRVSEGAGEDPFLGSLVAKAMVLGYQGTSKYTDSNMMACVKHFALYGAAEAGRDYNTVDMSLVKMYNEYLPPYRAAVDAGVGTVMSSFNEINGIPASANQWLMTDLLRKQWGFKGFVVTDYTAINEMIQHGMGDGKKVAELAIKAPVEMDMVGELFITHLAQLVKEKKVSTLQIDMACKNILEAKYKLGLFENPYKFIDENRATKSMMQNSYLNFAEISAAKSFVLLKNNGILPLNKNQKIACIGPQIKRKRDLIGNWSGAGDYNQSISIWDAARQTFDSANLLYAEGCNMLEDSLLIKKLNEHGAMLVKSSKSAFELIQEAVKVAKQSDVVVVALGESFNMSGEAASRSNIQLPENQRELLKALFALHKPIVLVLMNGRPLDLSWESNHADAILETWFGGTRAGSAIAGTLVGKYNPQGKLTMTFPRNVGQIPIYYNAKNTGRPFDDNNKYTSKYLDVSNDPLYPFGFGLSYNTYEYGKPIISDSVMKMNGELYVKISIKNTGKYSGTEIMQCYIQDVVGSITRPVKELKKFQLVELQPGESKVVQFQIRYSDLQFYNAALQKVVEPGKFRIGIGTNSKDLQWVWFKY